MSAREGKLCQLLLQEFRANHSIDRVVENVCSILGPLAVTPSSVQDWYEDYDEDKGEFYDVVFDASQLKIISDAMHKRNARAMILQSNEEQFDDILQFTTTDGRLNYSVYSDRLQGQNLFTICDLFHGESKTISIESPNFVAGPMMKIDEEHFTCFDWAIGQFILMRLDYKAWTINVVHSFGGASDERLKGGNGQLILNQPDKKNFVFYEANPGRYATGKISNTCITLDESINPTRFTRLHYTKVYNNKLYGLRDAKRRENKAPIWQFCELDLATGSEISIDFVMAFPNEKQVGLRENYVSEYVWSQDRLYVSVELPGDQSKIVVFNSKKLEWANIGITLLDHIWEMYVDEDEILTVKTADLYLCTFYRFPLKKPDKLRIIAWTAIIPKLKRTNLEKFKRLLRRLSKKKTDLICKVPSDDNDITARDVPSIPTSPSLLRAKLEALKSAKETSKAEETSKPAVVNQSVPDSTKAADGSKTSDNVQAIGEASKVATDNLSSTDSTRTAVETKEPKIEEAKVIDSLAILDFLTETAYKEGSKGKPFEVVDKPVEAVDKPVETPKAVDKPVELPKAVEKSVELPTFEDLTKPADPMPIAKAKEELKDKEVLDNLAIVKETDACAGLKTYSEAVLRSFIAYLSSWFKK